MVSMEMNLEEVEREEVLKGEIGCKKELVDCRCSELKEISKKAEARCAELESDIQKKNRDNEALEAKLRAMESDQHAIEDELKVVKRENDELKKHVSRVKGESEVISGREGIVDLTVENEEEDKLVGLMVENKVLECEKKRAESEVEIWKEKFKELESWVLELDQNSALRCVEWPLIGGAKLGLGLTNVDSSQVSDRKEVIGRIRQDNATNLDRVQNKAKVENPVGLQKPGTQLQTCFMLLCFSKCIVKKKRKEKVFLHIPNCIKVELIIIVILIQNKASSGEKINNNNSTGKRKKIRSTV